MRRRLTVGLLVLSGQMAVPTGAAVLGQSLQRPDSARQQLELAGAKMYVSGVLVSGALAAQDGMQGVMPCADQRLPPMFAQPREVTVKRCTLRIDEPEEIAAAAEFANGMAFVGDLDGVRQVAPSQLPIWHLSQVQEQTK